jgi:hypothetical protein
LIQGFGRFGKAEEVMKLEMPLRVLKAHQSGRRRRSMKKLGEKKRKMGPEAVDPPIQSCEKIRRRPRRWSRGRNTGMASATGINTQEQLEPSNLLFFLTSLYWRSPFSPTAPSCLISMIYIL